MTPLLDALGTVALAAALVVAAILTLDALAARAEERDRAAWERGPCVCECGGSR